MASSPALSSFLLFMICLSAGCAMARGDGQDDALLLRYYAINPTMTNVVGLNTTNHTVSRFGDVNILNGVIYEQADLSQPPVGTAQGMAVGTSLTDKALLTTLNFVFTAGRYNGSSLILIGGADNPEPGVANRAVVGGGGVFRLAQGYTHSVVTEFSPDIVVQFDLYVVPNKAFYY